MNQNRNDLVAYVSVRSIGGVSLFSGNAKLNAKEIHKHTSAPQDVQEGLRRLSEMRFQIDVVSELSIRIRGTANLFHKKLGLEFERRDESLMYVPNQQTESKCLDMGAPVFEGIAFPQPIVLHGKKKVAAPVKAAGKKTVSPLPVKAAKKAAKKVVVPQLPSATPPTLAYHHLKVPKDIVRLLNAGPVHAAGIKGQGVRAAMIDSGFHWSHPYFSGKGYDLSVALPAGSDTDLNGHGTGESANFLAIAPKTKLFGISMDDIPLAFQTCRTLGVQIISNSWGSAVDTDGAFSTWHPYWSLVLGEIALCAQANIIVLFSGGNGGMSVTASSPDVISVGGVYSDETGLLSASNYASSFASTRYPGQRVPYVCGLCGVRPRAAYIALPIPSGCEIDRDLGGVAFPNGDGTSKTDGWGVFSGTSAACPMTAGVVALMLSHHPGLTLDQVKTRLANAQDVTAGASSHGEAAGPGQDDATGHGLVDAERAILP